MGFEAAILLANRSFYICLVLLTLSSTALGQVSSPAGIQAFQAFNQLPLRFEKNLGQREPQTEYFSSGPAFMVSLRRVGVYLWPLNPSTKPIGMVLVGANREASPEGEIPAGTSNLYRGRDPKQWIANIPTFAQVRYRNVYPGIDLLYHGQSSNSIEYDFVLEPGADPDAIRIAVNGVRHMSIDQGDIVMRTEHGEMRQHKPRAYQRVDGVLKQVDSSYRIEGRQIAFRLGRYDPSRALLIDPVLNYSTLIGGSGFDSSYSIAADSQGNSYLTGETASAAFPTQSATQSSLRGLKDAFVLKLNASGTAIIYSTFLGGSQDDSGRGVTLDASGSAYITGMTRSADFPVTPGAYQTAYRGQEEAFVAKLDPSGQLVYATYLGGGGSDTGTAIAVDSAGDACVTGYTSSVRFPSTGGASYAGGYYDVFVTKFNPSGSAVLFSILIGGAGNDTAQAIALDPGGNIYVAGQTDSSNFPTVNAVQSSNAGGGDAFILKLNPSGSTLIYSTFLGGGSVDGASGIFVDAAGAVYVTGATASGNFPVTNGVFQTTNAGLYDVFVAKLSPAGNALNYSTYLGGSGSEIGTSIAVDNLGQAWVTGYTNSFNFPVRQGLQPTLGGAFDAFLSVLTPSGSQLLYSSFIGGSGDDRGSGISLDSQGNAYITGGSSSTDFFTTQGALQPLNAGGYDAFVLKISSPVYQGSFDLADCNNLAGWAADSNRLNQSINVDIYDGATFIATVAANQSRPDVGSYLGDNGNHGFSVATPASLKDGNLHSITVKFAGSATVVSNSPKSLSCAAAQYGGSFDLADCNNLAGWAADSNRLNQSINVDIYDGNTLIATVAANVNRPDVGSYLHDNGNHGFSLPTPSSLKTGSAHSITVKFAGTGTVVSSSPRSLSCAVPAQYGGSFDLADCNQVAGWAADSNRLNQSINVDLYDGATLIATVLASQSRPDVGTFLHDNGNHGFNIATPSSLKTGTAHSVGVKFGGTTTSLSSSPKSLTCP